MPQSFTFNLGPVTITVDGLPDSVLPESIDVNLHVHTHYEPEGGDPVQRFADTVAALGGPEAFGLTGATTDRNWIELTVGAHREPTGSLTLFIPSATPTPMAHPALERVLGASS